MSLSAIPRQLRELVRRRDGNRCGYCRLIQLGQASVFHINHVIPRSAGGVTMESNLVLQCPSCSLHKSDKRHARDPETGDVVLLFNPLEQRWSQHFRLLEDGTCVGLTDVGRATCAALRMNDTLPRLARGIQLRIGLLSIDEVNS